MHGGMHTFCCESCLLRVVYRSLSIPVHVVRYACSPRLSISLSVPLLLVLPWNNPLSYPSFPLLLLPTPDAYTRGRTKLPIHLASAYYF